MVLSKGAWLRLGTANSLCLRVGQLLSRCYPAESLSVRRVHSAGNLGHAAGGGGARVVVVVVIVVVVVVVVVAVVPPTSLAERLREKALG